MSEQTPIQETKPRPKQAIPRWVIVLGIITIIVLTVFLALQIAGVQHGPGLHDPSGFTQQWL